jgi:hypothetical protein
MMEKVENENESMIPLYDECEPDDQSFGEIDIHR